MTQGDKAARLCGMTSVEPYGNGLLPQLPKDLLQLVLDRLTPADLVVLLHTSKDMAQHVMQHRSGRLELRLYSVLKRNWAAIRQLLQCAPPASLKLKMQCGADQASLASKKQQAKISKEALHSMLGMPGQQLPCIVKLGLQGFVLTSVVPVGLALTCPNLHTLQLTSCSVEKENSNQQASSHRSGTSPDRQHACSVKRLIVKATKLPELYFLQDDRRVTRAQELAHDNAVQLRDSLPQLNCLHLEDQQPSMDLAELWGPQLKTLQLSLTTQLPVMLQPCIDSLQCLQKLVLPMTVVYGRSLQLLLKLQLHHLELDSVDAHRSHLRDLSSHPCTWRYLRLHLRTPWLSLVALARIPLHSLQTPLELGRQVRPGGCVQVELPSKVLNGDLGLTQTLALIPRLQACGITLRADVLCWRECCLLRWDEQQKAALLSGISQVFGTRQALALNSMSVGQEVIEAVAATHQHTLRCLSLDRCKFGVSMAHAALTQLPSLSKLEIVDCLHYDGIVADDDPLWVHQVCATCCNLSEAMAQQPAGRELEVLVRPAYLHPDKLQATDAWSLAMQQCLDSSLGTVSIKVLLASQGPSDGDESPCMTMLITNHMDI